LWMAVSFAPHADADACYIKHPSTPR
jgi:hypothetical protein